MVGSDHGMTDGGNHGGASYQEADALAIFVTGEQNSCSYSDVDQEVCSSNQIKNAGASATWSSFQVIPGRLPPNYTRVHNLKNCIISVWSCSGL